jgi:hypothetical protein
VAKFKYVKYASRERPGNRKLARFERALKRGPLGSVPDIEDWAMEEFWWHGVPDDDWHPLEAYLSFVGDRLSPAGHEQLRRWKEARIGFYEIGNVVDDAIVMAIIMQEWDPAQRTHVGEPFRAVTPGLGGVEFLRQYYGQVELTYVAPWLPNQDLYCAMGYGTMVPKEKVGVLELMLGLHQPAVAARPLPWKVSAAMHREHVREWKRRDWVTWLDEHMEFPFRAIVPTPPAGEPQEVTIDDLLRQDPDATRQFGVYVSVLEEGGRSVTLFGLTNVLPLDITSPNWWAVAEYGAYREHVGPPPGTVGQPRITRLR